MNRSNCFFRFEHTKEYLLRLSRYWPFHVIFWSFITFIIWYFPSSGLVDPYYRLNDQNSALLAIKAYIPVQFFSLFLPEAGAGKIVFILFYYYWLFLFALGFLLLIKSLDAISTRYRYIIFILPLILFNSHTTLTVIRTDVALFSHLIFLLGASSFLISRHIHGIKIFILLMIFTLDTLSYRSNSVLLLPFLIFYFLPILPNKNQPGKLSKYLLILFLFSLSLGINKILPVQKTYPLRVLMHSDILCTQLMVNNDPNDHTMVFPKYWVEWGDNYSEYSLKYKELSSDWKQLLEKHPKEFLVARSINYLQFLFIGIVPEDIYSFFERKYPNINFPPPYTFIYDSRLGNFCLQKTTPEDVEQHCQTKLEQQQESLLENTDHSFWKNIIAKKTRSSYMIFPYDWTFISRLVFTINAISTLMATVFGVLLIKGKIHTPDLRYVAYSSLLATIYLLSFLIATPTPDIRFHLTSVILGIINISVMIIWAICLRFGQRQSIT